LPPPPPARSIAGSPRYMACGSSDDDGGQQRATGVGCARQRILSAVPATTPAPVLPSAAQSLTLPATPCDLATRSLLRGITATWTVRAEPLLATGTRSTNQPNESNRLTNRSTTDFLQPFQSRCFLQVLAPWNPCYRSLYSRQWYLDSCTIPAENTFREMKADECGMTR